MRSMLITLLVVGSIVLLFAQQKGRGPEPRVIHLDPAAAESTDIFTGPPQTVTMRSGHMVLAPGKSVGLHSTRTYEEALIVLSGKGEMRLVNGPVLRLKAYDVAYCPPATEHNVFNTGADTLRYIWLVARAEQ